MELNRVLRLHRPVRKEQAGSAQDDTVSLVDFFALLASFELDPRVLAGVLDVFYVAHRDNNVVLVEHRLVWRIDLQV